MTVFYMTVSILSLIFSVGAIDGPTGMEQDNWTAFCVLAIMGIFFGFMGLRQQIKEQV